MKKVEKENVFMKEFLRIKKERHNREIRLIFPGYKSSAIYEKLENTEKKIIIFYLSLNIFNDDIMGLKYLYNLSVLMTKVVLAVLFLSCMNIT